MAFIRWKLTASGSRVACLMVSYRDEKTGKPRNRMLAHIGLSGKLAPERIEELKKQFSAYKIDWDKIKSGPRPKTNITQLSDAEILKKMRVLRHECGLSQRDMRNLLHGEDIIFFSGPAGNDEHYIRVTQIGKLEKALEQSKGTKYFEVPERELAPALRKIFASKRRQ